MRRWVMIAALAAGMAGALWGESATTRPVQSADTITHAQLEKITWNSVMDPPPAAGALVFPDVKTAAWLDKSEFREGEPVNAWLAVRSLASQPERGMLLEVDLGHTGEKVRISGNVRLQLLRQKPDGTLESLADVNGGGRSPRRLEVPPEGFFINRGDVRNLVNGSLPPGEYVLKFWAQGQRAEATFSVKSVGSVATTAPATQPAIGEGIIIHWTGSWDGLRRRRGGGGGGAGAAAVAPLKAKLENGWISTRMVEDFSKGLAMGIGNGPETLHFVRLADLPQQDDAVQISAKYIAGMRDHVEITLTPVQPAGDVQFPGFPQVYFLVENLGPPARISMDSDRYPSATDRSRTPFNGAIVLDVELPDGWPQRTGFSKKVQLSAIVTSDPVRYGIEPRYAQGGDVAEEVEDNRPRRAVRGTRWVGAVKSLPMEVTLKDPTRRGP